MSDKQMIRLKGISPLVATVLLIAFVVAVAGIIAAWVSGFARTQTELVSTQSELSITCSFGNINMKNLKFQSSGVRLSGALENNGQIPLGNITLSVVYQNATSQTINLCTGASGADTCTVSNLSLTIGQQTAFNLTIWGSNYDSIKAVTNCSSVSDTADRGDIS